MPLCRHLSLGAFLLLSLAVPDLPAQPRAPAPYPGITFRQHELAQRAMHEFFAQHWESAESTGCEMFHLEQADTLLPLSNMLRFAMRAWRILNDEFDSPQERETLEEGLKPLRTECIRILHKQQFADSTRPMRMFLEAGINGFNATLIIRSKPLSSLSAGLQCYRTLDSIRTLAPQIKDVYLGLGLFQCSLANEPGIIGFALHLFNRLQVSLDSGLTYLRICSDGALYTREGAKEYLLQFLSPTIKNEAAEKRRISKSLEAEFPGNPFYVFQDIDEEMAFHRKDVFSSARFAWAVSQVRAFDTSNSSARRFANLVKWQCAAIDSAASADSHMEPAEPGSAYSFYPVFLVAAKLRFLLDGDKNLGTERQKITIRLYHRQRKQAFSIIRRSDINPMLREYYLWHMEDGLP